MMDIKEVMGGIAVVGVVVVFVYLHFFGYKCFECGRKHAIDKSGETRKRGFFQRDLEEWKCKYCGHRVWKAKPSPYAGGGGDGGNGG